MFFLYKFTKENTPHKDDKIFPYLEKKLLEELRVKQSDLNGKELQGVGELGRHGSVAHSQQRVPVSRLGGRHVSSVP